jgi:hypothetical protein
MRGGPTRCPEYIAPRILETGSSKLDSGHGVCDALARRGPRADIAPLGLKPKVLLTPTFPGADAAGLHDSAPLGLRLTHSV